MSPPATVPTDRPASRWPLRLAAGALVLEAVAIGIFGALVLRRVAQPDAAVALGSGLLFWAYGGFLLAVARGVLLGRRWARGPGVATQLLHLPIAWSFRQGAPGSAVATFAAAVAVLVCLLLPASTAVFGDRPDPGDPLG